MCIPSISGIKDTLFPEQKSFYPVSKSPLDLRVAENPAWREWWVPQPTAWVMEGLAAGVSGAGDRDWMLREKFYGTAESRKHPGERIRTSFPLGDILPFLKV